MHKRTTPIYLFDWGDTLMVDYPEMKGKMCDWDKVGAVEYAEQALCSLSNSADIYLATAAEESSPEDIRKAFARVGLDRYIDGYFCRQNTGFVKAARDFYLDILRRLDASPSMETMAGNSLEKDILPCHALGLHTIWFTADTTPDIPSNIRVISSLSELPAG